MRSRPADEPEQLLWRLEATVPEADVDAFEHALAERALSVSRFDVPGRGLWRIDALFVEPPDPGPFNALLRNLGDAAAASPPTVTVSRLPDKDWVRLSLGDLKPVTAGRFFVCGRHDAARVPANAILIQIEAGPAFGTGHHETTRGCLLAIERLARRYRARTPLDLGCGSGVLAIAMAKTWRTRVIASDIDPVAVRTALENGKINGVGDLLRAVTADGFGHQLLARNAPYDLIVANILAGPLRTLAPAVARHAAANGYVVLSGLLTIQEREVTAAFARQGLYQWRRIALSGWTTLILRGRRTRGA